MEVDRDLHRRMAEIVVKLKQHFQTCLLTAPHYGEDPRLARDIDTMGNLIKEMEDLIVIADVRARDEKSE